MQEKHVMIVENSENKIVQGQSTPTKFTLEGIFTEFDIENRNKRIYTAENFVPVMESTLLAKKSKLGVVYGEYDHPDIFDVSGKNASHVIESLTYNKELNRIDGSITMLETFYGNQATAIIKQGYPLFVSSRAAGITTGDGRVQLKELFTYDIVLDPGFASARVQPKTINESLSYGPINEETNYRIYEMSDTDVQKLFKDNKNDIKVMTDMSQFEKFLKEELAKSELKVTEMIKQSKSAPEEVKGLLEQIDSIKSELSAVNKFLEFLQPKFSKLMVQNSKLVAQNKRLETELNESTMYANSIAAIVKKVNSAVTKIDERLDVNEKFTQYVAEHASANILFSTEIMNEHTSAVQLLEYVAEHVKNNKEFLEYIAEEVDVTQKFAESIAVETKDGQEFLDYVANEKYKDEVWLDYVSEKVDGLIKYQGKFVDAVKGSKLNESNSILAKLESIDEYLGEEEEQEMVNNITNNSSEEEEEEEEENTASAANVNTTVDEIEPVISNTDTTVVELPLENLDQVTVPQAITVNTLNQPATDENQTVIDSPELETAILNKLVKCLSSEDTGMVIEILPGGRVVIQKTGCDDTFETDATDVEEIEEPISFTEKVNLVLAEIKKQKALENAAPHFFTFLNESQISDFKGLNREDQAKIIINMNESEYYSAEDVLGIISKHLNDKALNREEGMVSNMPEDLKESWNGISDEAKKHFLTESKYFNLKNVVDIHSFWNTRTFAKDIKSPESIMIKESLNNTEDSNSDKYEEAFLKAFNQLK